MGMTNKETNMPETTETMPQRITLDDVTVRHIQIHDSQFDSHYEDLVSLKDVKRLVEQANCLICLSEGKASGLQYALNALHEKTPKSKKG